MGRAGGGGGGGSSSYGGGHHVSRGGSGHRVGGSGGSRPGGANNSGFGFSGSFNRGYNTRRYYNRSWHCNIPIGGYGYRGSYSGGKYSFVIQIVVILVIAAIMFGSMMMNRPSSTIQREKLNTGKAFWNDCIVDELGWINNAGRLSMSLKHFYDKTGVQPVIYLKAYDESLVTDEDKELWAENFYESKYSNDEHVLLYVYFAEKNTDLDVGYMYLQYGYQSGQVFDAEAIDIFWRYMDSNWESYDSNDTDNMLKDTFNKTADVIMKVSTTTKDLIRYAIVGVVLIVISGIFLTMLRLKFKRAKEEAEETERILSQPLQTFEEPESDLESRYR